MSKVDVEQGRIDQICSEFFSKAAHIVLQSRIPACDVPPPPSKGVKSNRWFNVDIKDTEFVRDEIEPWRRYPWNPCVVDILLQPESSNPGGGLPSNNAIGGSVGFRPATADGTTLAPLARQSSDDLTRRRGSWDDRGGDGLAATGGLGPYPADAACNSGGGGGMRAPGGLAGDRPASADGHAHDHHGHRPGGAESGSGRRGGLCAACEDGTVSDDSSHGGGSQRSRLTLLERWVITYHPNPGTDTHKPGAGSAAGGPTYRQPSPHSTSPRGMPPPGHAPPPSPAGLSGSALSSMRGDDLGASAGGGSSGGGHGSSGDHVVEVPVIYKRAVILLRSLLCLTRMLPAYDLYRACSRSSRPPGYSLVHRIHACPDAQPGFCSCPPNVARARGGAQDLGSFTFAPVHTSQGRLEVTVAYRHTVALPPAEDVPPPSPLPHIIAEYIGGASPTVDPLRYVAQDAKPGLPPGPTGASPSSSSSNMRGFATMGGNGAVAMPPRQNSMGQLASRGEAAIAHTLAQFGFVSPAGGGAGGVGAGTAPSHPQGSAGVVRVSSWSSTTPFAAAAGATGRSLPHQGGLTGAGVPSGGGWPGAPPGAGGPSPDMPPSGMSGGTSITKAHSLGRDTKSRPPPSPSPSSSYGHSGGMAIYGSSPPPMQLPPPPHGTRQISPVLSGTSPNGGGMGGRPGMPPDGVGDGSSTRQLAGGALGVGDGKRPSSAPVRIPFPNNGGGINGGPSAGALLAARGAGVASTHHAGGGAQHRPYTPTGGGVAASNPMPVLFRQASAPVGSLYAHAGSSAGGGGYSFGSSLSHGSMSQDGSLGSNGGDASSGGAALMGGAGAAPMLGMSPHRALTKGPGSLGGVPFGAAGMAHLHGGGAGLGIPHAGGHLLKRTYSSGSAPPLMAASPASGSEGSSGAPSVLSQSPQLPFAVAYSLSASQSLASDTGHGAAMGIAAASSGGMGMGIADTSPPMSGRAHAHQVMGGLRSPSVSPVRHRPDAPPQHYPPPHPHPQQHAHGQGSHAVVPFSSSGSPNGYPFMGHGAPRFHLSDAAGVAGGLAMGSAPHRKLSGLPPGMLPQPGVHLPSSSLMFCSGQPGGACGGLCGPNACGGKAAHLLPHQLAPSPMRVEWGCWLPGTGGTPADGNLIMAFVETSSEGGTDTTTDDLDSFPFAVDMDW
eukprot:jgi/Mesvir1/24044/Mv10778-RA.2